MSQIVGQTPFVSVPISQRLPDQMQYKDALETASVVSGRQYGVRYTATNGGPYTIGTGQAEIQIPITSDYYLDLETFALSYEVKLQGNTSNVVVGNPVLESGPLAPFAEISLDVGGVQVSRIRDPNTVYNIYNYMGTIQSHENSEGTIENSWASSQKATCLADGFQGLTDKIANLQDASLITSQLDNTSGVYAATKNGLGSTAEDKAFRNADRNGIKLVQVPLSKILGLFGGAPKSYFPCRNVGAITLRLRLHNKLESAVVCRQNAGPVAGPLESNAAVVLNDVHVHGDVVVPESAYLNAMDQLLASASGLQVAFEDTDVQVRDFTGASSITEYAMNFLVGARYLTGAAFVLRHTASLNSSNQCSTFSFPSAGFQQARLQLGSMSVPTTTPVRSIEDAYYTMLKANNMQGNVDYGNAISLKEYCADISRTGADAQKVSAPSKFILAFNLAQVLQSNDLLQGLNTLMNNSNIQLVADLRGERKIGGNAGESVDNKCTATGVFRFMKVLSIKMNAVSVEAR